MEEDFAIGYHKQWAVTRRPKSIERIDRQIGNQTNASMDEQMHVLRVRQAVLVNIEQPKLGRFFHARIFFGSPFPMAMLLSSILCHQMISSTLLMLQVQCAYTCTRWNPS